MYPSYLPEDLDAGTQGRRAITCHQMTEPDKHEKDNFFFGPEMSHSSLDLTAKHHGLQICM